MSLCYLYSKSIAYPYVQTLINTFQNSSMVDLDTVEDIDYKHVYVIELNNADKEISQKLVNIFKTKKKSLIYFIIPKNHTLLLFQLTYLLETKSIVTYTQDIEKFIAKIKSDQKIFAQDSLEQWLGAIKLQVQDFIIYKDGSLVYVTPSILTAFESSDKDSFEQNILSQIDAAQLLQYEIALFSTISMKSSAKKSYQFKSRHLSENEKIIYIKEAAPQEKSPKFMSSRVSFIELLKETILQTNVSQDKLALLSVNISNIKELLAVYGVVAFEEALLELLMFMESILDKKLIFSQFENHFYTVLFKDTDFTQVNNIVEHFSNKLINYLKSKETLMMLDFFTFDLKDKSFSDILMTLDKMENKNFKVTDLNSQYIKHFTTKDREVDALHLLNEAFKDNLKLKILNIYNGLVVNTASTIKKVTDENIYITFEPLQGVMLNLEKKTVIQSESFSQDILADVKQISYTKNIAVLENFRFLNTNANSRQYARVTTPIKVPITINTQGNIINGVILDISIKSVAIKVKKTPKSPMVPLKKASLVFNLVDTSAENGYTQLQLSSKVIMVTIVDTTDHYKVICDLDQDSHGLDIVSRYVYDRQKELIIELKKMAKLNY